MSINRQNYEEYFLMYADGELSIHQRMEVEWFVQQNPDLAAELELLHQARLVPDDKIVFAYKEDLFKIPEGHINLNNYEEYFISFIDNELSKDECEDVEKFILQHPQLQAEFALLKQTVSEPEAVIFENKEMLYRHKEDKKPVEMKWWRIAAAAVLLLGIATVWYKLPKHTQLPVEVAETPKKDTGKAKEQFSASVKPKQLQQDTLQTIASSNNKQTESNDKQIEKKNLQPVKADNETADKKDVFAKKKQEKQPVINVPVQKQENNTVSVPSVENKELIVIAKLNNNEKKSPDIKPDVVKNASVTPVANEGSPIVTTSGDTQVTNVNPALYKELDTEEDDARRTVYVASIQLNKNKIKTFFKKASRIFGGKNEEEQANDGKLQVANFELDKANK